MTIKNAKKSKMIIPAMLVIGVIGFMLVGSFPTNVLAEINEKHELPQIVGSIEATDSHWENIGKIGVEFSDASNIAKNQVSEGKVISGKLSIIQGYLVNSFSVMDESGNVYRVVLDAGNGEVLYVSEGKSIDEIKNSVREDKHYPEDFAQMKEKFKDRSEFSERPGQFVKEFLDTFNKIPQDERGDFAAKFQDMRPNLRDSSETSHKNGFLKEYREEFGNLSHEDKEELKTKFQAMKLELENSDEFIEMKNHMQQLRESFKEKINDLKEQLRSDSSDTELIQSMREELKELKSEINEVRKQISELRSQLKDNILSEIQLEN